MIGGSASSNETGTSMRAWLYLGAGVLALTLMSLRDRIVDESAPPASEPQQQADSGSARHAVSSDAQPVPAEVQLIGRGAQH